MPIIIKIVPQLKKQNQENNSAFTKHEIIPDTNQLERFNKKP